MKEYCQKAEKLDCSTTGCEVRFKTAMGHPGRCVGEGMTDGGEGGQSR